MQQVERQLQTTQAEKDRQQQQLRRVETDLGQAQKAVHRLQQQQASIESRIERLQGEQQQASQDVVQQRALLSGQLRAAYAMGRQQRVKLMLNQEKPEQISRMLIYYEYFNQARIDQLTQLNQSLAQLKVLENQLGVENQSLTQVLANTQSETAKLDQAKLSREQVIRRLDRDIQSAGGELEKLQADEKRLQQLLASIRQAINDIPLSNLDAKPFAELKGQLPWPLKGKLLNRYGSKRQTGVWDGVLIDAREGQPIRSISHGRVVFADWLRGYGLLVIIDHGAGYMSLYAFNQSLYKEVGDWVHAGEEIAAAGASGGRDNAGLYFGIRKQGKPINPAQWCRAIRKGRVG